MLMLMLMLMMNTVGGADVDVDVNDFQLKSRGRTVGGAEDHLGSFFIALPLIRKGYRNITLQVNIDKLARLTVI